MRMIALLLFVCLVSIAWKNDGGWDQGTTYSRQYADVIPAVTNTYNLGSSTKGWKNLEIDSGIYVDGSVYMTTADGGATGGAGLYLSQPDGGCSKCYVDAAGTTFSCADITCPAGM